ncbi:MAG: glutathione peroxidase [Flavobacteriales bacterium]|nr:glutathione peroxidase [Flavobacteriales bacterium]
MKTLTTVALCIFTVATMAQTKSLHDFKANTLEGSELDLSTFKGKKVLVVNVASKCGLTPQYADLQKLYEQYGSDSFEIIGFPANNFMGQEPGSSDEIAEFCQKNYGVTFTMMEKVSVKGKDQSPIYKWLTSKEENGVLDGKVSWNFEKFLINEDGKLVKNLEPKVSPIDTEIVSWLTGK